MERNKFELYSLFGKYESGAELPKGGFGEDIDDDPPRDRIS